MNQWTWIKLAKETLSLIFAAAMIFSSIVFFWYFFKINYYPISGILSNTVLLFMVGSMTALFLMAIIAPILLCSHFWHVVLTKKSNRKLLKTIKNSKTHSGKRRDMVAPIFLLNVCAILILATIYLFSIKAALITWLITILSVTFIYLPFSNTKESAKIKFKSIHFRSIVDVTILSIYCAGIITLITLALTKLSNDSSLFSFVIIYTLIFLSLSFSVTEKSQKYKNASSAVLLSAIILYIMLIFGSLSNLPHKVMKILHLGNLEHASISTDKVLCEIFKDKGKNIECSNTKSEYIINDVNILWRIGEYYIQFQSDQKDNTPPDKYLNSIIIDAKHVYAIN